jgi:hypothetical protein
VGETFEHGLNGSYYRHPARSVRPRTRLTATL